MSETDSRALPGDVIDAPRASITRGRLYALLRACATHVDDSGRFESLWFESDGVSLTATATDGHTLCRAKIPAQGTGWKGAISGADTERLWRATKPARKEHGDTVAISSSGEDLAVTLATRREIVRLLSVDPPPWAQILRPSTSPEGNARFSARLMAKAWESVDTFRSGDGSAALAVYGTHEPARISYQAPDDGEITIVIMPMRV
jgi:hypothetical protein